jgi:NAD(P)-dependent dehydrogenase (short-subunit alcohol dehydrogenase family)
MDIDILKKPSSLNPYLKSGIFKNKHIIITGSTGAIGSEVLSKFLQCGSKVVAFYNKTNPNFPELSSYIKSKQLTFIQLDFQQINTKITDKFKEALTFLEGILDILIFCHGKFFKGDFRDVKTVNFDKNININVRANLHFLSLAVPFLKVTKGNVVMLSSVETKITEKGEFLHALGKSMINSLVQNSALELASFGIRINAVAPSFVDSEFRKDAMGEDLNIKYLKQLKGFHLLNKKIVAPDEVADAILFLASNEANFMTGEIVNIDCGFELNHDTSFLQKDEIENDNFLQNDEDVVNNINNINNSD